MTYYTVSLFTEQKLSQNAEAAWFGRVARRKPLLSKHNAAAGFRFPKLHLNKPQDLWNVVLWTDGAVCGAVWTKHSMSAQKPHSYCQKLYFEKCWIPARVQIFTDEFCSSIINTVFQSKKKQKKPDSSDKKQSL